MKNLFLISMGFALCLSASAQASKPAPMWVCVSKITQPLSKVWEGVNDTGSGDRLVMASADDRGATSYLMYFYAAGNKAKITKNMDQNKMSCSLNVGTKNTTAPGKFPVIFGEKTKSGPWSLVISDDLEEFSGESSYRKSILTVKENWKSDTYKLFCASVL